MSQYHVILGIPITATKADINSAFKKLSKRYYPGVNKKIKTDEEAFKKITNARMELFKIIDTPNNNESSIRDFSNYSSEFHKMRNDYYDRFYKMETDYKKEKDKISKRIKKMHLLWVFRICFWNTKSTKTSILYFGIIFCMSYLVNIFLKIINFETTVIIIYFSYSTTLISLSIIREAYLNMKLLKKSF